MSIPSKSRFRPIFDSITRGHFDLVVSNEILSEYIEVIENKASPVVAANIASLFTNLGNVIKVDVYYKWNLIEDDFDDNKFVDCAVASNARFIVTEDRHFRILKRVNFPKVDTIGIEDFLNFVNELRSGPGGIHR
jgi:putative PIN family toxin of toxin-antitoxin system